MTETLNRPEQERSALYAASCERLAQKLWKAARAEWSLFDQHMAELHIRLAGEHEVNAARLREIGGSVRTCTICPHPQRRGVDATLASERYGSSKRVSSLFSGSFSRAQVRRHRDWCLGGLPRIRFCILLDGIGEEDVLRQLREEGKPEESIEVTLAAVRWLRGGGW